MTQALTHRLSPELRISLDIIRALAAGYVVLHHLSIRGDPGFLEPFLRFGQEAVMAFFLLSGFVIHANERHRAQDIQGYGVRRAFRIYPTLIAAMLVSIGVALVDGQFQDRFEMREALCTLFALQDARALKPGTICRPFMGNSPLWSLSYEIVFYIAYPFVLRKFLKRPGITQHIIGLGTLGLIAAYTMQPSHFLLLPSYFLIWWCGAMMAEACLSPPSARKKSAIRIPLIYLFLASAEWAVLAMTTIGFDKLGTYPILMIRHFLVSALLVSLALLPSGRWFVTLAGWAPKAGWAWVSSISYGIYVIHFPLLIQWSVAKTWGGLALAALLLVAIAFLADRFLNQALRHIRGKQRKDGI